MFMHALKTRPPIMNLNSAVESTSSHYCTEDSTAEFRMKRSSNGLQKLLLTWMCLSSITYAGTMGSPTDFSGLWAGVGGSYINTVTTGNTNITMLSTASSTAEFLLNNNLEQHFTPVANAGYLFDLPNHWLVGVRALYKYLGTEQYDQSWSGTFQDGTYQTGGLHTNLNHEFFLLLEGGYSFGNWLAHAGLGPSFNTVGETLNGDILPATSFVFQPVNITKNQTIWGGAGQVGFEYMLPNRFMVDVAYNFVASGRRAIPTLVFPTGVANAYTTFSQKLRVVEQGITITVNKYFM